MTAKTEFMRLKNLMGAEKTAGADKFNDVLKSDLFVLLKNYFELSPDQIHLETQRESRGIGIRIAAKAEGVKRLGGLPER